MDWTFVCSLIDDLPFCFASHQLHGQCGQHMHRALSVYSRNIKAVGGYVQNILFKILRISKNEANRKSIPFQVDRSSSKYLSQSLQRAFTNI